MNVLLIYPSSANCVKSFFIQTEGEGIGNKPPLGLLYIASYIKEYSSHNVSVIDLEARPIDDAVLLNRIEQIKPDVIGISCWTDFWFEICRLVKLIKESNPGAHITLGGPHIGIFPALSLSQPGVNSVIMGDGEALTLNLIDHLDSGVPLMNEGVYLKNSHNPHEYTFYIERNLDRLPYPDRSLLPMVDYTSVLAKNSNITTMITSRGCPHRCIYCKLNFQKTLCVSAQNVINEMEEIAAMGVNEVEIYDDTFTWSKPRLAEICKGIVARGINLKWAVRDRVNNVTEENLRLMKQAGCNRIHLGIESGAPDILKRIKKGITLEQARNAVALAKKVGLKVLTYFMIGLPGETRKEVLETIDFAISLDADYAEFNITIPYPGTAMYQEALSRGIIPFDYWSKYVEDPEADYILPFVYEEKLSKSEMVELRNLATKKYYVRPKIIYREIVACSSLNEFKKKAKMGLNVIRHAFSKD